MYDLYVEQKFQFPRNSIYFINSSHRSNFSLTDPSGTPGPQMTQRNNNKYYTQSGESFTTSKNGEDNIPPPKIAPPVFLSVPPPPPVAPQNGPPVPPSRTRPPPGYMTGGPPRRNAPVRSHSMSIADVNRYVCAIELHCKNAFLLKIIAFYK